MDFNLEVIFQNTPEIKSIRRHLEKVVEKLDQKFEGIEGCRVAFDMPYHHRYPGNIYDIKIEVSIPGNKIKTTIGPSIDGGSSNIYFLIDEAFAEIERKLELCAGPRELAHELSSQESKSHMHEAAHLCRRAVGTGHAGKLNHHSKPHPN